MAPARRDRCALRNIRTLTHARRELRRSANSLSSIRWEEPKRSVAPVLLPHHSKTSPNELEDQQPPCRRKLNVCSNFSSQLSVRSEGARPGPSRTHNPKVVGSNPTPATMNDEGLADVEAASPFRLPRLHPGIGWALIRCRIRRGRAAERVFPQCPFNSVEHPTERLGFVE